MSAIRLRLLPGLVVEDVAASQEGQRAGLLKGDILLAWSRGEIRGALESPFELSEVEVEQSPRGAVTLEGSRGAEKRTWMLGPDVWGIRARPNFEGLLLKLYKQGKELVNAGNLSDATTRWRRGSDGKRRTMPIEQRWNMHPAPGRSWKANC